MTSDPGIRVVRWRRDGHDRLYVNATDGQQLGWHDLTKDRPTSPSLPAGPRPIRRSRSGWQLVIKRPTGPQRHTAPTERSSPRPQTRHGTRASASDAPGAPSRRRPR